MKLTDVDDYKIAYRLHASKRLFERQISDSDVEYVLKNGEIIERYDDDYPLPSLLINGYTSNNRPLGTSKNSALRQAQRERLYINQLLTFVVSLSNHEGKQFLEIPPYMSL